MSLRLDSSVSYIYIIYVYIYIYIYIYIHVIFLHHSFIPRISNILVDTKKKLNVENTEHCSRSK